VADVFTPVQPPGKTLRIGSVKGNIGHGEPAAGLSGLIKTVLCLEKGVIPGNPTFVNPSPKIDFEKLKLFASRTATPWPDVPFRRASINSFGYGGSNAHVVMDDANALPAKFVSSYVNTDGDVDFFDDDEDEVAARPYLLAFSANDEKSCENQVTALDRHLSDPAVSVKLRDLAYTLGERRSRHYYRSFHISTDSSLDVHSLVKGHIMGEDAPRVGLVFTGQGAQWPEMGKALLATIPLAARTVRQLDEVLQRSADPPTWTLYDELSGPRSAEHMRNPELSQPLVTALQLALLSVFRAANVT
jgi:acyl transferase domain-containing protein